MKSTSKKRTPSIVNLTVKRRYLTHREIDRLIDCARKHGRYGHRDATMILVAYRHGLRGSSPARACTHKSTTLIDVRLAPTSGAKADIS